MPKPPTTPVSSPHQSVAPPTASPLFWALLAMLPIAAIAIAFFGSSGATINGHPVSDARRLVSAFGTGFYVVSLAFYIGFCVLAALRNDGTGHSFAWRLGKALLLFLVSLVLFVLMMFLDSGRDTSIPVNNDPAFNNIDGSSCGALAGIFVPLAMGFLLKQYAESM